MLQQKNLANFYSSVYKQQTNGDRIREGKPAEKADCDAHAGNFKIGFYQHKNNSLISENKARFNEARGEGNKGATDREERERFGAMIKKHNFEFTYNMNGEQKEQY